MPAITDIKGIRVGHAGDLSALTGCTVILCPQGALAGADIRGGATGTREFDVLSPAHLVQKIHAVLLSGGSAFGLGAADGVMRWLEERGAGFDVGIARVPIVPSAIIFDLWIGNPKRRPDSSMAYEACENASSKPPAEGSVGAGVGATVGKLLGIRQAMKGGVGTWSITLPGGIRVGVLSVVNAWGDVRDATSGRILAGTRKSPGSRAFADSCRLLLEGRKIRRTQTGNTTLSVVATNARLTRAEACRVASMAHDGMARAISPVHTQLDGDIIFVLSTGKQAADLNALGVAAAQVVAESIARGVKQARSLGGVPAHKKNG